MPLPSLYQAKNDSLFNHSVVDEEKGFIKLILGVGERGRGYPHEWVSLNPRSAQARTNPSLLPN